MLNKDYANTILNANRLGLSLDFSPVPNKWEKLPQVVSQGISDWDKVQKTNAYVNALQGGNQDEINQAWSAYDPQGFANYQQDQAQRAEERQWHLDDLESQRQFQREQQDRSLANQMRMFNMRQQAVQQAETDRENQLKSALESGMITADEYNQAKRRDLLGEIAKTVEPDVTEEQSRKQAQDSINQLAGVAQRNNIGVFTDWRRSHGLTGAETEREYGRISSAVAGLAPRAISKLKEAGVSGINSLPEFMTYIGLPQKPTSEQIAGAIPMMAQIAGVDNPLANQPTQAQKMKGLFGKSNGIQAGQKIGNFTVIGVE